MSERPSHACPLTRRRFGVLAASGLGGLALGGCRTPGALADESAGGEALAYPGEDATPVIAAGVARGAGEEATERAVRAAALAATDFSWLGRGDTVLVKPVCNSGNAYPATTDPLALRAMIALLRERGAGRVIVADMSGIEFVRFSRDHLRGSTRELMHQNRMAQTVEAAGGEVHAFEEAGWDAFFEDRPAARGSWVGPILLPNVLEQADHVVLMPRCARHLLAGSTLGMKAAVGWWRHDARLEYHRDAATLLEKTADANTVPSVNAKQRLVLTSATKVLTTFGPDQGYVAEPETGLVIASTSLVAHDMVSLAWLLENRRAMPAAERDGVFDDPNRSAVLVNFVNRIVTAWLGGVGAALRAQWLSRHDLRSIWDDRVLRRAFDVHGGVPRVELVGADASLPAPLRERLSAGVALPARGAGPDPS
jgi:uncharacterized protein (DUF362 family)